MKIHLGKTATSRTRKKKVVQNVNNNYSPLGDVGFTGYLLKKGYSDATIISVCRDVKKFKAWLTKEDIEIETLQYNDITAYLQSLGSIAQHTKGCYLRGVKQYFNFLIGQQQCTDNPAAFIQLKGLKRKTLYEILSRPELDNLYHHYKPLDASKHKDSNQNWFGKQLLAYKRNKVILGLMLYQCIDTRDLKLLTVDAVKLKEGKIYVPGTRRSEERELKLEAMQIIDMMEYLLKTRNELLQLTGKANNNLFISIGSSDNVHYIMKYLIGKLNAINKKVTSVKQLKASVIVHWLKIYNLRQVQYMAGHRYVSSTEQFLVNEMDGMIEDIEKYHPII